MGRFKRRIPPKLGKSVEFQLTDAHEYIFTHANDCSLGTDPGNWSWLGDFSKLKRHLASYSNVHKPKWNQHVGVALYGNTATGESVVVLLRYKRSFRVEVDKNANIGELVDGAKAASTSKRPIRYRVELKPRRYGWKSSPEDNRLPKKYTTIVVDSTSVKDYDNAFWGFKKQEKEDGGRVVEIHEDVKSVPTHLKALIDMGANYGNWLTVPVEHRKTRHFSSDYELVVDDIRDIAVDTEKVTTAPMEIAGVDIECHSKSRRFPSPENPEDVITMIGIVHRRVDGTMKRMLFRIAREGEGPARKRVTPVADEDENAHQYTEHIFGTEKRMLLEFRAFVVVMDIRMLLTFNGDRFDWKYILRRANNLGINMDTYTLMGQHLLEPWNQIKVGFGTDTEYYAPTEAAAMKSAAVVFDATGRIGLDLRFLFQKTMSGVGRYRFKHYSLDSVAARLVGATKNDMPPSEMFRIWESGTPGELRKFCDYCMKDVELLLMIMDKELLVDQIVAMANTSSTSYHGIINNGPFKKVNAATTVNAAKLGLFTNNKLPVQKFKPKGATVVTPVEGAHGTPDYTVDEATGEFIDVEKLSPRVKTLVERVLTKEERMMYKNKAMVGTLDFASLYPSIMMSFVMCVMTIILPGNEGDSRVEKKYPEPKVSEQGLIIHEEIIYEDDDPSKPILRRNRFVQNAKAPYRDGILPKWEAELKKMRKRFKGLMKSVPEMRGVYDARQLATKISMNAVYGVLKLFCVYIAESVTNRGRVMLDMVMKEVRRMGHEVVYGDSVTEDTAVVVRVYGEVKIMRIADTVTDEWRGQCGDKEYVDTSAYLEVLDENGWTRVDKVIRHRVSKPLWRITTHTGVVDCTEDHSLLTTDGDKIKPTDTEVGNSLMHLKSDHIPFEQRETSISAEEARGMGLFFADGSAGEYHTPTGGVRYSWAVNKSDRGLLERMQDKFPFPTTINNTIRSSGVYKLVPVGDIKGASIRYRRLLYNKHREKVVPEEILFGPINHVREFFEGFYDGDGDKKSCIYKDGILVAGRFDHRSKTSVANLVFLCRRLGYRFSINTRSDKLDIFRITFSRQSARKPTTCIKKMERLPPRDGFVYDFETASHHFHVEPGNLVVHNTDSVMVKEYFDTVEAAWKFYSDLEDHLNEKLFSREGDVNALEFEKLADWFLLMGKKCYFMNKKEKLKDEYKMSSTGTCDVRRDRPAILTDLTKLMGEIMSSCRKLAVQATGKVVMEAIREHFEGMINHRHPVEKYAVTTTIQTINENTEKKAHMVLARRLEKRDGVSFTVGDAIDVVQIKGPKKVPDAEKVATPQDLKKDPKGLMKVDTHLYLKKKVVDQTIKMARFYVPKQTLDLMIKEYDGVMAPPKKDGPRSKSIVSMFGAMAGNADGNLEEERRKRLFYSSYKRETDRETKRRRIQHDE